MAHTLLLADDSATIQRVIELTFANEDIDVVTVGEGALAIEAIERAAPDIVLADVGMPGKNGYDIASFVRSDPALARIPVVLLTGAFEPLDEARCDGLGRHEVLVKPFEPRRVIGKVRELLGLPDLPAPDTPEAPAPAARVRAASAPEADVPGASGAGAVEAAEAAAPDADEAAATGAGEVVAAAPAAAFEPSTAVAGQDDSNPQALSAPVDADPPREPAPGSAGMTRAEETAANRSEPIAASPGEAAADRTDAEAPRAAAAAAGAADRVPPAGDGGSVLARAFMTFLAVEQGAAPPAAPAEAADPGGAKTVLPEAMMDDLAGRVLERLTDTVLQDAVAEVVSRLAERLAREEITRVSPGGE